MTPPHASEPPHRIPLWAALTGAALVGMLTAVQARVNGQLGVRLQDGLIAAEVSFVTGLVVLLVVSFASASGRRGMRALRDGVRSREIPWWMLLGGLSGAFVVATQGLAVGIIGVSLFTVGMVAGQTLGGLLIDRIGYGPAGVVALTLGRVSGAGLALVAVVVSVAGQLSGATAWPLLVLPVIAGAGVSWQQATNGRLGRKTGNPLTATLMNFVAGTAVLTVIAVIDVIARGLPASFPSDVWLYTGGAIGALYVMMSAALVSRTGVLLLGLSTVVGQIVASAVIDLAWPAKAQPSAGTLTIMIVLALASVVVAAVPWHRLRARQR